MELQEGSQTSSQGHGTMAIYSPLTRLKAPEGPFTPPYDPVLKLLLSMLQRGQNKSEDQKAATKKGRCFPHTAILTIFFLILTYQFGQSRR